MIDDDQDDLEILKETIAGIDPLLNCLGFIYPLQAMKALREEFVLVPDFIFTDINMPGMTGIELVQKLREQKEFNDTIITVLSTSLAPDVQATLKKIGVNHSFQKPAQVGAYHTIVTNILGFKGGPTG